MATVCRLSPVLITVIVCLATSLMPAFARADITTGLVGWWKMDEGTSTTEHDSSGNGNIATSSTTGSTKPAWVSGKFGNALQFDGSSSYVNTNSIANKIATGSFTVSLWFKLAAPINTSSSGGQALFTLSDSASGNDVALYFNNNSSNCTNGHLCGLEVTPANGFQGGVSSQASWAANTWYHAVYTFDTTAGSVLYVNGVVSGTSGYNSRGAVIFAKASAIGAWSGNQGGVLQRHHR